jgi:hypothetical protein
MSMVMLGPGYFVLFSKAYDKLTIKYISQNLFLIYTLHDRPSLCYLLVDSLHQHFDTRDIFYEKIGKML